MLTILKNLWSPPLPWLSWLLNGKPIAFHCPLGILSVLGQCLALERDLLDCSNSSTLKVVPNLPPVPVG